MEKVLMDKVKLFNEVMETGSRVAIIIVAFVILICLLFSFVGMVSDMIQETVPGLLCGFEEEPRPLKRIRKMRWPLDVYEVHFEAAKPLKDVRVIRSYYEDYVERHFKLHEE